MKPIINFAHANGFPAPCYNQLFSHLRPAFDVGYIDTVGHDERYPITDNWHHLEQELIEHIEQSYDRPVIGVGHSLGGVLSFLASVRRPELFEAVILLDAPVLGRFKSHMIKAFKILGFMNKITPAGSTRKRRSEWDSEEEAYQHLRDKPNFKNFTDACLRDYVHYGMEHSDGKVKLRFDRDREYEIYCTLPHNLYRFRKKIQTPMAVVYGQTSNVITAKDLGPMQRNVPATFYPVKGGHLFPFEYPEETATVLKQALKDLSI